MIQLRFTSPQSSPVVAREALVTLSCLLKKTLQDSELETKTIRIDPDIMQILKSQSTPTMEREPRILSPDLKFFLEKAQSTIPKSLSMILHLVPTQHSTKVKNAGIELSRSILFDLQDGLNEKVSSHSENDQPCINDKLHTEALECTIILSRDPDGKLICSWYHRCFKFTNKWGRSCIHNMHRNTETIPNWMCQGRKYR